MNPKWEKEQGFYAKCGNHDMLLLKKKSRYRIYVRCFLDCYAF